MDREDKEAIFIMIFSIILYITLMICAICEAKAEKESEIIYVEAIPIETEVYITSAPIQEAKSAEESIEEIIEEELEAELWNDSLEYLALCVEAEAGNQTELGKRLVCDVVLNRYDSGKYETLYDVINEEHKGVYQFSVVQDGRIFEVIPAESTYRIVAEELENRTNTEVLYFRTEYYHTFGTPLFQEDDHYFSK